jgi:formyltetrahydrofolate hydrolase
VFVARAEWELHVFQIRRETITHTVLKNSSWCVACNSGLTFSDMVPKVVILASKLPCCLQDLLIRHHAGKVKTQLETSWFLLSLE